MSEFHLKIHGPNGDVVAHVTLDADQGAEALKTAASVISPFGHDLWDGDRFLARFGPRWGEHLADEAEAIDF